MSASGETSSIFSETAQTKNEGDERGRTISKGVRSLTAQNIGTSILALVFVSALVRYLPGSQYGVYSAISIVVSIAAAFATFGLQDAATRFVSIPGAQRSQAASAVRKIIFLSVISSAVVSLFVVVFSQSISLFFTKSASFVPDFELGAVWLFSNSIALIFQGVVQGLKKYSLLAKILFVSRAVMVALTIAGLAEHANLFISIYSWIVYGALVTAWAFKVANKELREATSSDRAAGQVLVTQGFGYASIFRYTFPLGLAGILIVATQNSDLAVVGGYLNPFSLGVYNSVITISSFLSFVLLTPLITAIFPEASSSSTNSLQISNGLRLAFRFIFLGVLPASFFVAATSPQLLLVLSGQPSYLAGSISLELIAAFYSLLVVQTVVYSVLQAIGRTFHVLLITLTATVAEICGSIMLVPDFGLFGAALARVLGALFGAVVSIYLARGLLVKRENQGFYWKAAFSALFPFSIILYFSNFVSPATVTLVPYSLIWGALFLFCIRAFKLLNNEDRVLLSHILPGGLKKLLSYI